MICINLSLYKIRYQNFWSAVYIFNQNFESSWQRNLIVGPKGYQIRASLDIDLPYLTKTCLNQLVEDQGSFEILNENCEWMNEWIKTWMQNT